MGELFGFIFVQRKRITYVYNVLSKFPTYLIGYDLNSPREAGEYTKLEDAIKSFGTWWHHLDSTWLVVTSMTAKEVRDKLQPHIKGGDELLVAKASGEAAWAGFSDKGSSWLKEHL